MARTVAHRLGTDLRFQMGFLLLGVVIAVSVGLITDKLGAVGLVLGLFSIVVGLCKSRNERPPSR